MLFFVETGQGVMFGRHRIYLSICFPGSKSAQSLTKRRKNDMMGEKKNQRKTVGVLPDVGQTGRAESERFAVGIA